MSKREVLLPPYLSQNPLWLELVRATDQLFSDVDFCTEQLRYLRDPYALPKAAKAKIQNLEMLQNSDFSYTITDKEYLVKQVSFVGLNLTAPEAFSAEQLLVLFRHLSEYWFNKGTVKLESFLNFVLKSDIKILNLWTEDYVTFFEESPAIIAASVYNGGTYYPTTHLALDLGVVSSESSLINFTFSDFVAFFNDISNYNLVIFSVTRTDGLGIRTGKDFDIKDAETQQQPTIGLGLITDIEW